MLHVAPAGIVAPNLVAKSRAFVGLFQNTANKADYSGDHDTIDLTAGGTITLTPTSRLVAAVGGQLNSGSPNSLTSVSTQIGAMTAVQNSGGDLARAISTDATMAQMFIQLTGTTSTVDLDIIFGGTQARIGGALWIIDGTTLTNTAQDAGNSIADPGTDTQTTTSDGFCLAYSFANWNSTNSWTGVTEETSGDAVIEGVTSHSAASALTNGSNITPEVTRTGSPNANRAMVAATW